MRIGILIVGQLRRSDEEVNLTIRLLRDAFPTAEFCYALWRYDYEERKELCDGLEGNVEIYDDFDLHYQPYIDNKDAVKHYQYYKKLKNPRPDRHPHQTKPLLLHNNLMKKYGHRYDVIIRTRFDSMISPIVDFMPIARECFVTPAVISVMMRSTLTNKMFDITRRTSWLEPEMLFKYEDGHYRLIDCRDSMMISGDSGIILHRTADWNCDLVDELHNTKKLLAGEFGWHQILIQGTDHHQWIHYDGGACMTRCIDRTEKDMIKELIEL